MSTSDEDINIGCAVLPLDVWGITGKILKGSLLSRRITMLVELVCL